MFQQLDSHKNGMYRPCTQHSLWPFGKYYEVVLLAYSHCAEYPVNKLKRHVLMKQVTHAVHENALGLFVPERLSELLRVKGNLVELAKLLMKALVDGFGIAAFAAG
jgi:hypothetical protein